MIKNIAKNPVARHNYIITDTIEAGIVLTGTEIKSIRNGKVNLKDSYAGIKNGEAYIYSMHISPYEQGNIFIRGTSRHRPSYSSCGPCGSSRAWCSPRSRAFCPSRRGVLRACRRARRISPGCPCTTGPRPSTRQGAFHRQRRS